jgi:hypothetical protein
MALARCPLVIQDEFGNLVNGASVEVRRESDNGLQPIFSDRAGVSSLGNPFTAADGADAGFHAAGGVYKITATAGAFARTWRYVAIGLAAETDGLASQLVNDSSVPGASVKNALDTLRGTLIANRTYFVRTDGNNANSGLVNSAGGAWATIDFAIQTVCKSVDFRGFDVTIKIGPGTWTEKVFVDKIHFGGDLILEGDITTPSNVLWHATGGDCLFIGRNGAEVDVQGFEFRTTTSGSCLRVAKAGQLAIRGNCIFGPCAGAHIYSQSDGAFQTNANYTISGGAQQHFLAEGGSIFSQGKTITLSGTPSFSDAFAVSRSCGSILSFGNTFSGVVTGLRYRAWLAGAIQTFGAGASYFPGDAVGVQSEGGHYDADIKQVGQLWIAHSTFPPLRVERTTGATNTAVGAAQIVATTTGDMADGFAVNLNFAIQDNAAVINELATIQAVRAGADNSGDLAFLTVNAGSSSEKLRILKTGELKFGVAAAFEPNGAGTVTISNLRPANAATATITRWLKFFDEAGIDSYIPVWQ